MSELDWIWTFKSQFLVRSKLGNGSFASVWAALDLEDNEEVALKVIDHRDPKIKYRIEQECNVISELDHPNICKFKKRVETVTHTIFVLERCGDSLLEIISRSPSGRLKEKRAKKIFATLLGGVKHIHKRNIVHRDLKVENILVQKKSMVKIIDFGLSCRTQGGLVHRECVGSLDYASPEVLLEQPYRGPEVDVWSLGVVLFAMLTGSLPFLGHSNWDVFAKIVRGDYKIPKFVSKEASEMISAMLNPDPNLRVSLRDLTGFPWIWKHFYDRLPHNPQMHNLIDTPRMPLSQEEIKIRFKEMSSQSGLNLISDAKKWYELPQRGETVDISYLEDGSIVMLSDSWEKRSKGVGKDKGKETHTTSIAVIRKQPGCKIPDILEEFLEDNEGTKSILTTIEPHLEEKITQSKCKLVVSKKRQKSGRSSLRSLQSGEKIHLKKRVLTLLGIKSKTQTCQSKVDNSDAQEEPMTITTDVTQGKIYEALKRKIPPQKQKVSSPKQKHPSISGHDHLDNTRKKRYVPQHTSATSSPPSYASHDIYRRRYLKGQRRDTMNTSLQKATFCSPSDFFSSDGSIGSVVHQYASSEHGSYSYSSRSGSFLDSISGSEDPFS